MKRNKDLALVLLELVEELSSLVGVEAATFKREYEQLYGGWDDADAYHLDLLVEGGLLIKNVGTEDFPTTLRLTWAGHDFIDLMQSK